MGLLRIIGSAALGLVLATGSRAGDSAAPGPKPHPSHVASLSPKHVDIATEGEPMRGDPGAPVTLVEFADFECPFCARSVAFVDSIAQIWPHDVKIVFEEFPIAAHANAELAAEAAYAAADQGAFWKMHDLMYAWGGRLDREALLTLAAEAGLDQRAFAAALVTHRYRRRVQRDIAEGKRVGVDGTPTFFLDGREYLGVGVRTIHAIRPFIEAELAAARAGAPHSENAPPAAPGGAEASAPSGR